MNVGSEEIPEINENELMYALESIKRNKAPGEDNVIMEMIEEAAKLIVPRLRSQLLPKTKK